MMRPHETPQGFFSAQDTADPNAMAEYLKTCVIAPCRLLVDYSVERYKQPLMNQECMKPIIYRCNSSVSSALIKTYKFLGHMAPIPSAMSEWSPSLFKLLTSDLEQIDYLRKSSPVGIFTSTNIPALVGILIYLEYKDLFSFSSTVDTYGSLFVKKGGLKLTKHRRSKGAWPKTKNETTWASAMPFKVALSVDEDIVMDLHQAIGLLLYGGIETKVLPGTDLSQFDLVKFRQAVNEAIQSLTPVELLSILREGRGKSLAAGEPFSGPDDSGKTPRVPMPYLTAPQLKGLPQSDRPQDQLKFLTSLHLDLCAKVLNVGIHRQKLILDLTKPRVGIQQGNKKRGRGNPGVLNHLTHPKKAGKRGGYDSIPPFFDIYAQNLAESVLNDIANNEQIDFLHGADPMWESLPSDPSPASAPEAAVPLGPPPGGATMQDLTSPGTASSPLSKSKVVDDVEELQQNNADQEDELLQDLVGIEQVEAPSTPTVLVPPPNPKNPPPENPPPPAPPVGAPPLVIALTTQPELGEFSGFPAPIQGVETPQDAAPSTPSVLVPPPNPKNPPPENPPPPAPPVGAPRLDIALTTEPELGEFSVSPAPIQDVETPEDALDFSDDAEIESPTSQTDANSTEIDTRPRVLDYGPNDFKDILAPPHSDLPGPTSATLDGVLHFVHGGKESSLTLTTDVNPDSPSRNTRSAGARSTPPTGAVPSASARARGRSDTKETRKKKQEEKKRSAAQSVSDSVKQLSKSPATKRPRGK
jgi:hypothetical protein